MKRTKTVSKDRQILNEEDFIDSCKALWGDINVPWGYYLSSKHFPLYEELLRKYTSLGFTEEMEVEARIIWQIANSPLAKALNEEDP